MTPLTNPQLEQCLKTLTLLNVEDEALTMFLEMRLIDIQNLDNCILRGIAILNLCDYYRTIPRRISEVSAATSQERVEGIVRKTISNGIYYKMNKALK